jgi:hypothetical protein
MCDGSALACIEKQGSLWHPVDGPGGVIKHCRQAVRFVF